MRASLDAARCHLPSRHTWQDLPAEDRFALWRNQRQRLARSSPTAAPCRCSRKAFAARRRDSRTRRAPDVQQDWRNSDSSPVRHRKWDIVQSSGPGERPAADRRIRAAEFPARARLAAEQQRLDAWALRSSTAPVRPPTDRAAPATVADRRLRRPDRPRSGSRRKHCRNADADVWAGTRLRPRNFRNASAPAANNIAAPRGVTARVREWRIRQAATANQPRRPDRVAQNPRDCEWEEKTSGRLYRG